MTQRRNDNWRKANGTDRWKTDGTRTMEARATQEQLTTERPAPERLEPEPPVTDKVALGKAARAADRWAEEQLFEEDVRAVLSLMRPNRRERLAGWSEYRTGGAHFRATVSWDEEFEQSEGGTGKTRIPHLADVLEAILVGCARHEDDLPADEEFEIYRSVLREVYRRLNDLQECYE